MLSLAPVKYANALSASGGPVERVDQEAFTLHGRKLFRSRARLKVGILPESRTSRRSLEADDGVGVSSNPQVASHMAISSAIESWAYYYCQTGGADCSSGRDGVPGGTGDRRGLGGLEIESSRVGFAAFPGLFRRQSRKLAFRKSVERHCLANWWAGALGHHFLRDPQPGIRAIQIHNPYSNHDILLIWRTCPQSYRQCYAYAAGSNLNRAMWRALVNLDTLEADMLRTYGRDPLQVGRRPVEGVSLSERRMRYFSSTDGVRCFLQRLEQPVTVDPVEFQLVYDAAVPGPWESYASVWRTIASTENSNAYVDREDVFCW